MRVTNKTNAGPPIQHIKLQSWFELFNPLPSPSIGLSWVTNSMNNVFLYSPSHWRWRVIIQLLCLGRAQARSSFIHRVPHNEGELCALHKRRWLGLVILLLTKPRHPEIWAQHYRLVADSRAGQVWDLWGVWGVGGDRGITPANGPARHTVVPPAGLGSLLPPCVPASRAAQYWLSRDDHVRLMLLSFKTLRWPWKPLLFLIKALLFSNVMSWRCDNACLAIKAKVWWITAVVLYFCKKFATRGQTLTTILLFPKIFTAIEVSQQSHNPSTFLLQYKL